MNTLAAAELFLNNRRALGRSSRTRSWYRANLQRFAACYPELPTEPEPLEKFLSTVVSEKADEMRHGFYRTLRALYRFLYRRRRISSNPMDFIDPPTRRKKVQPALSPQEMFELLKNVQNSRDRALISLIIDSGPRITEALTLKKQSIFDGYIVVDGKEGERKIPISEETRLQLLALVNSDGKSDYVFSGQRGHLTSSGAYHIIAKYMRQAHISAPKLGPHRLRHAFGKNYIENGGDLRSLQKIMGHADMKTTQIYVNLAEKAIIAKHHQFTPLRSIQAAAQYTLLDSKEVLMEAEAILKIK